MAGPTVAQIAATAQPGESLWHFLAQIPGSQDAQIWYALVFGASLGMVIHYIRRWAEQEIAGNLWDYLFCQTPRRTLLSVLGILSWSAGEVAAGLFTTAEGAFIGWALVIISGLKTGYAGDSLLNKSVRQVWPDEKRAQKLSVVTTEERKP